MQQAIEVVLVGVFALVGLGLAWRAAAGPLLDWQSAAGTAGGARRVGPYALGERIAAGAMGEVYRARHLGSGHLRALKLLPQNAGEREQRQFEREARAGARL